MIMMADVWYSVKNFLLHATKGISRTAKSVVRAVRFKFDQVSTSKKHRALIRSLGEKVFELSSTGVELPSEAADIVNQINQLNEHAVTTKDAYVAEKAVVAEQAAADKAAWAEEKAAHAEAKAIRKAEMEARKQVIAERAAMAKAEALAEAEKVAAAQENIPESPQPEVPVLDVQETTASQVE